MNPFAFWIGLYVIVGLIIFVALITFARKLTTLWGDICEHGVWGALLGFTVVVFVGPLALVAGLLEGLLSRVRTTLTARGPVDNKFEGQARTMLAALREMDRAQPEMDAIVEEVRQLRAEMAAGKPVLRERVDELDRKHVAICGLASRTMVAILEGLCMECRGKVREATPAEGVGAWCERCSALTPYGQVGHIVEELKRRGVGIWGMG